LAFEKANRDLDVYGKLLTDFIALSEEFVRLQIELDATGHYKYSNYDEVRAAVYDNAEVMENRYLNGLLLSQAFWINHYKMLMYFIEHFCHPSSPVGSLLEVPSGTGIFISEFARMNPGWTATALDLSESSVAFTRELSRLNGAKVDAIKCDVFELPEERRFDRIICGELLEHLEQPELLLEKLARLLAPDGAIFLTTAVWAANIDHIYLYVSAREARDMIAKYFTIDSELVLNVKDNAGPEDERTPINYACIGRQKVRA
jgi:2-polyprenyl-3-methyl-5-hydroxy-6-metoxy-1,4-benzoquinol methylase